MKILKSEKVYLKIFLCVISFFATSCATTRIVTIKDCADAVNVKSDTTVYHYFWGLKKAADIVPACDSRFNHLNMVTVKSKPKNALITVFTLGIVVPQTFSWCCAVYNPSPGTLGNN